MDTIKIDPKSVEMYADDQDEDVEEEEEFHEVEEEKHKTSQDAVNDSNSNHAAAPEKVATPGLTPKKDIDWANIMLRNESDNSEQPASHAKNSANHTDTSAATATTTTSESKLDLQEVVKPSDDSIIENIIKDTQDKLKIVDESCDSIDQNNLEVVKTTSTNTVEPAPTETSVVPSEQVENQPNHLDKVDQLDQQDQAEGQPLLPDSSTECVVGESDCVDLQQHPDVQVEQDQSLEKEATLNQLQLENSEDPSTPASEQVLQEPKVVQDHPEQLDLLKQQVSDAEHEAEAPSSEKIADGDTDLNSDEKKSEEVEEKKELDLDEDVKNPQYIPKKGVFYEHDDRSHDIEEKKASTTTKKEEDAVETKEATVSKRTPSQDKQSENRRSNRKQRTEADRWNHDLFRGEKQKPKSKSELINAYGYDIRQERGGRNQQSDSRQPRSGNSSNTERTQISQDGQRSRQSKDSRIQRQNQPNNRSRERRARRQNVSKGGQNQRNDGSQLAESKRDMTNTRSSRGEVKDPKDHEEEKQTTPIAAPPITASTNRREQDVSQVNRNPRNDSRGRRKTSRDRPTNNEERLPPANTVMPPITTWSNEDMMKAEAFGKKSPPQIQSTNATAAANSINNNHRDRSNDQWQQSQQNKTIYQDRSMRNPDDSRQQGYSSRGRYQERGDENHRPAHYLPRNHYHDRTNQNQDWHRANNFSPYGKSNDYIVKTQTFENSRLSQANMSRSSNNRDLREVINERRMQGQQNFQNKPHHSVDQHASQRGLSQGQMYHHQYAQSQLMMHQHHMGHNQQQSQQTQRHMQIPTSSQQQTASQPQQTNPQTQQPQLQNHRQQPTTTQAHSHQGPSRSAALTGAATDVNGQDSARVSGGSTNADPTNSRPIIKTDTYTGNMHSHQQPLTQHSQNHRSMSGPMTQQNPATSSHMVPSHMGTGAHQPQYYTPSPGSRDPTANAAAVATAYHGYIPSGHAVMDATRYHMASQQLTDHGYMTNSSQTSDVSGGPVLHQQGMYPDTSAGGPVASSAFMAQHPGSTISPNNSIPVTGTGPQLPPVSYIQHSQYPPPPYSNPYSQPQHNQGPPQTGHAYPPYWTYI